MSQLCVGLKKLVRQCCRAIKGRDLKILCIETRNRQKGKFIQELKLGQFKRYELGPHLSVFKYRGAEHRVVIHNIMLGDCPESVVNSHYAGSDSIILFIDALTGESDLKQERSYIHRIFNNNIWHKPSLLIAVMNPTHSGSVKSADVVRKLDATQFLDRQVACYSCAIHPRINIELIEDWIMEQSPKKSR